jgi:hypothetical protein
MQNDKLKSYLSLHLIVFIWGFTAILGALITINAEALVWYRMLLAGIFLASFIVCKKESFKVPVKAFLKLIFVGLLIALDILFQSNSCFQCFHNAFYIFFGSIFCFFVRTNFFWKKSVMV